MGMTEVIFELKPINSKIRGVALVTYCVKNMTITFLPMLDICLTPLLLPHLIKSSTIDPSKYKSWKMMETCANHRLVSL